MTAQADLVAVATLLVILTAIFSGYVSVVWVLVIVRRLRQQDAARQMARRTALYVAALYGSGANR